MTLTALLGVQTPHRIVAPQRGNTGTSHQHSPVGRLLRDPWVWGVLLVMAVLGALLSEWLPEPWGGWAPFAAIGVVGVFTSLRAQRDRG